MCLPVIHCGVHKWNPAFVLLHFISALYGKLFKYSTGAFVLGFALSYQDRCRDQAQDTAGFPTFRTHTIHRNRNKITAQDTMTNNRSGLSSRLPYLEGFRGADQPLRILIGSRVVDPVCKHFQHLTSQSIPALLSFHHSAVGDQDPDKPSNTQGWRLRVGLYCTIGRTCLSEDAFFYKI